MYLRNGGRKRLFGRLFSAPFPPEPQSVRLVALTPFRFLVQSVQGHRKPLLMFSISILTHPTPSPSPPPLPFFQSNVFGSSSSVPKIDFSPSILRVMARDTNGTVFLTGLRPHLPRRSPLSSCLSFLLTHERATIANPSLSLAIHIGQTLFPARRREKFRKIGWCPLNHKSNDEKGRRLYQECLG